ncbi:MULTISPECIES: PLDc N-terminal domain-containing protein [Pedobacter]|uniref:Heme/copper-type cytochrome/quinol oxidase subunit 4 n=1 Tax=Pedobacter zeae TaxID=1737356 RepID=A0A7W6KCH0_9SPHI|nr:PLD nuclease N-terminal domain-containing protein [Pedobacter zeae]MBB4109180.1 heme/copper-type cytochrome/quinol oxidase subunit 4 [Pedobacter zeae]
MLLAQVESNRIAIIIIIAAILWLALILTALYHISRNSSMAFTVKVLWFIIILFAPFIGSIIYLIWGKNKKF